MLKNILNLDGAKKLSKSEQLAVKGAIRDDQCYANLDPVTCAKYGGVYKYFPTGGHHCLITRVPEGENYQYIGC